MTSMTTIDVRILGRNLPGQRFCEYQAIHVGMQRGKEVIDLVPGDAREAVFAFTICALHSDDGQIDFRGPFVHGKRGARFLYLSWGELLPDGQFRMFRRAKMQLSALAELDLADAEGASMVIEAVVNLTGPRGDPICASLRPPQISWRRSKETERTSPSSALKRCLLD